MSILEILQLIDPIDKLQLNRVDGIQVGSKTIALRACVQYLLHQHHFAKDCGQLGSFRVIPIHGQQSRYFSVQRVQLLAVFCTDQINFTPIAVLCFCIILGKGGTASTHRELSDGRPVGQRQRALARGR